MNRFVLFALCSGLALVALGSILMHGEPSKMGVDESEKLIIPFQGTGHLVVRDGCLVLNGDFKSDTQEGHECLICLEPNIIVFHIKEWNQEYRIPIHKSNEDEKMKNLVDFLEESISLHRKVDFHREIFMPYFDYQANHWEKHYYRRWVSTYQNDVPMSEATRDRWMKLQQPKVAGKNKNSKNEIGFPTEEINSVQGGIGALNINNGRVIMRLDEKYLRIRTNERYIIPIRIVKNAENDFDSFLNAIITMSNGWTLSGWDFTALSDTFPSLELKDWNEEETNVQGGRPNHHVKYLHRYVLKTPLTVSKIVWDKWDGYRNDGDPY